MKDRSLGKRIALAFAAVAIGIVVWIIWGLFLPTSTFSQKILDAVVGLAVMIFLTNWWSGKRIALIVAVVMIAWIIGAIVAAFMS